MMPSLLTHWLTPHYSNNHRPKLLQPIGLSFLVAVFLLVQSSFQLLELAPSLPGGFVLGYASNITADQVIELTNTERAKVGLPSLTMNSVLNQAALAKANDMFAHDYWAHVSPEGKTPWDFIQQAGYSYTVAGENLARDFGDTPTMIQAWMDSETHRANIVHTKYTQIGIAVVNGTLGGVETTLVVQMFGTPTLAQATTPEKAAVSTEPIEDVVAEAQPLDIAALEPVEEVVPALPVTEPEITVNPEVTLDQNVLAEAQPAKVVSPLTFTKVFATSLVVLLVMVLTYDSIMTSKKRLPRRVGNNWAHIGFLGIILLIIIAITQGKVI